MNPATNPTHSPPSKYQFETISNVAEVWRNCFPENGYYTVRGWFQGRHPMSAEKIRRVEEWFGITPGALYQVIAERREAFLSAGRAKAA